MSLRTFLVSDSLGTPVHGRGILNFTVGLIEELQRQGSQITLLAETTRGFRLETHRPELETLGEASRLRIQRSILRSHLSEGRITNRLKGRSWLEHGWYKARAGLRRLLRLAAPLSRWAGSPLVAPDRRAIAYE